MGGAGYVVASAPTPPAACPGGAVTLVTCQPRDAVGSALPCLVPGMPCLGSILIAARHSLECGVTLRSVSVVAAQRLITVIMSRPFTLRGVASELHLLPAVGPLASHPTGLYHPDPSRHERQPVDVSCG